MVACPPMRPETCCAVEAVRAAGAIAALRTNAEIVIPKGELDLATGTDIAAEDAVRAILERGFPTTPIVGEERGGAPPGAGGAYWLVDPLCGTRTFACRIPAFCANVALVEAGRVSLAAVFDGAAGEVCFAERGQGAYVERAGAWHRLSAKSGPVLGFEVAGDPMYQGSGAALGALFGALTGARRWHIRLLGTTLSLARVATGDFSGMFLLGQVSSPLHTAAGCLLAEEAGATVTDPRGNPWDLSTTEFVLAATPDLHRELLAFHRAALG